jgi:hypothetical protein
MEQVSTANVDIWPKPEFGKVYVRDARGVWPKGWRETWGDLEACQLDA